ncbi:gephyrin-like molybdotransferase Glp [uncultured Tenacibaculum sp.]|uniref:molybdopterin molybdotransferase MoeA n=1 Tax=uncultured Tenacibaculum sp. TaxID=174713 RepID=UPI002619BEF6|nr:gephyrin-like molybdotransferase Glp [uncultured Tenacibaculum sp.]
MISVENAIQIIKKHSKISSNYSEKKLEKANGYLLAEDIIAPIDLPPFNQSAMDGYGLCLSANLKNQNKFDIVGEIKAGDTKTYHLNKGEAIRVLTGAPVPKSVNTVIMQENTLLSNDSIKIKEEITPLKNIRLKGEQVKKGTIALEKHTEVNPAVVGFLYSLGIDKIKVIQKPSIAIISTGNELVESGKQLAYGEIYESNSKMLTSALYNLKFYDVTVYKIKDDYEDTLSTISNAIKNHDLLLISGGISVGKYDFIYKALHELNVSELLYKVNQKPGKPFFYGIKNNTQIFGLPGNPAAALTCFYTYVNIALQKFVGKSEIELPRKKTSILNSYRKKGNRSEFLKANYSNGNVTILEQQGSAMLQKFAFANALIYLPEHINFVEINDSVEIILLPF